MFKNYMVIALRYIFRDKLYSLINITGLATGMACAILILLWVQDELSYDRFHTKAENICQAYLKGIQEENTSYQSTTSPAIAAILKNEYPEIIDAVRIGMLEDMVVRVEEKIVNESAGIAADPSLFNILTYTFIQGDAKQALTDPFSIVLTESMAHKYFGERNPLGQSIRLHNKFNVQVTGIIKDLPVNAYYKFDYIVPFVFLKELGYDIYGSAFFPCNYLTFVLLKDNINYKVVSDKISKRIMSEGREIKFEICLVPLLETYLFDTGGRQKLYVFSLIAFIIVILASINFMNLATARSINRSREIGVRKVAGANRGQLITQFLGESTLITAIAIIIAIILADFLLPEFNAYTGKVIKIQYLSFSFISGLVGIALLTGILAGLYPALFISSLNPANIFKDGMKRGTKKTNLRKSLIFIQFVLSIFFIICTIVMSKQINYIRNFNLGLNKNNIVYIPLNEEAQKKSLLMKNALLQHPNIVYVSTASKIPISIRSGSFFQWGVNDDHARRICETFVDYDYLKTFDIKLSAGRFYDKSFPADQDESIVVNEAAMDKVGLSAWIGKPFYYDNRYYTLIGVVKNFQHNSPLNEPPGPIAIRLRPQSNQFLFVKINPKISDIHAIGESVSYIKSVCQNLCPDQPLQYQFLNNFSFGRERIVQARQKLMFYSTILAIVISCLGLFGISSFLYSQRIKEIGIRKALGASVATIVILLTRNLLFWVMVANLVAWPIAWYAMNIWLQNFYHRVTLEWWIFLASGILALVIAGLTVGWLAVRSAIANPIDSLRYE
jgi:putative ABC transport system permease protein